MSKAYVLLRGGTKGIYSSMEEVAKKTTSTKKLVTREFDSYDDAVLFAKGVDKEYLKKNIWNPDNPKIFAYVVGESNYCDNTAGFSLYFCNPSVGKSTMLFGNTTRSTAVTLGQLGGEAAGAVRLFNYINYMNREGFSVIPEVYLLYRAFEFYYWKEPVSKHDLSWEATKYRDAYDRTIGNGVNVHLIRVNSYKYLPESDEMLRKARNMVGMTDKLKNYGQNYIVPNDPLGSPII